MTILSLQDLKNRNIPLLQINHISKFFGGVKAVNDVSFTVEAGSIHGLIGPNGSGKTTLFNCLTGIYRPTAGRVDFTERKISGLASHRIVAMGIARTFQNLRLFSGMTVLENVMVGRHRQLNGGMTATLIGTSQARCEQMGAVEHSQELLTFCGLEGRENVIAGELPYGLQRRLEVARALATEPQLLLLDEPAAGMNPAEATALKELIFHIRDRGVTVLIIEHNVRLVMGLCERICVMDGGELIADDIPEKITNHPAVIEAYLGREDDDEGTA